MVRFDSVETVFVSDVETASAVLYILSVASPSCQTATKRDFVYVWASFSSLEVIWKTMQGSSKHKNQLLGSNCASGPRCMVCRHVGRDASVPMLSALLARATDDEQLCLSVTILHGNTVSVSQSYFSLMVRS